MRSLTSVPSLPPRPEGDGDRGALRLPPPLARFARRHGWLLAWPIALGCGDGATDDGSTAGDDDDDLVEEGPLSSFTEGRYVVTRLALEESPDVDGDEEVDNNLASMLVVVDIFMKTEDFSVPGFNAMLAAALYPSNIILLDARHDGAALDIGLLYGEEVEGSLVVHPESVDDDGAALVQLPGAFTSEADFGAGPTTFSIPVTFFPDTPPTPIEARDMQLHGTMDDAGVEASLRGVIPFRVIVEDIVDPMIPEEGYDLDGDGVPEPKSELMDLIWSLAPTAGDVDLGGGETGVSAWFRLEAEPATF